MRPSVVLDRSFSIPRGLVNRCSGFIDKAHKSLREGRRIGGPLVTAPVLVVLLVVEPLLMRVAIHIAIAIYERANATSGPMS